jgi:hypothetical protein
MISTKIDAVLINKVDSAHRNFKKQLVGNMTAMQNESVEPMNPITLWNRGNEIATSNAAKDKSDLDAITAKSASIPREDSIAEFTGDKTNAYFVNGFTAMNTSVV